MRLSREVDATGLAAFRVLFSAVLLIGVVRTMASGWVEELLIRPTFFFKYPGFEWVPVPDAAVLYALLAGLTLLALCMLLGFFARTASALFCVGFAFVQLMDATNYLNHYYLVVLLTGLMACLPISATLSVDAWRNPAVRRETVPAWTIYLLRFQVGLVYVFAAFAKFTPDWLLHAQPLGIWLAARSDTPLLGPLFAHPLAPWVMSWGGFLYDLTIVLWLSLPRTRTAAYLLVLVFHGLTAVLFDIGMFPLIMVSATTLFFAPDWPRRLLRRTPVLMPAPRPVARWLLVALTAWCTFHVVMPLRHYAEPGDVLWNDLGMRWSWKVMVREKSGSVTFRVRWPDTGREVEVNPKRYLEWRQLSEMSARPALVVQMAHHVAADLTRRGVRPEVRADALASLNGAGPSYLLDPTVDLTRSLVISHGSVRAPTTRPCVPHDEISLLPARPDDRRFRTNRGGAGARRRG